jgi:hypothetical protein
MKSILIDFNSRSDTALHYCHWTGLNNQWFSAVALSTKSISMSMLIRLLLNELETVYLFWIVNLSRRHNTAWLNTCVNRSRLLAARSKCFSRRYALHGQCVISLIILFWSRFVCIRWLRIIH